MRGPGTVAQTRKAYRQSLRNTDPAQRNAVNCVPAGAVIVTMEMEPRGIARSRTTLLVIRPRRPVPRGSHARLIFIPTWAKPSNAVVLYSTGSAWQLASSNVPAVARVGRPSATNATQPLATTHRRLVRLLAIVLPPSISAITPASAAGGKFAPLHRSSTEASSMTQ